MYLFPEAREANDLFSLQFDGTAILFPQAQREHSETPAMQHATLNPFTTC